MPRPSPQGSYTVGSGISPTFVPVFSPTDPNAFNVNFLQGQEWINTTTGAIWELSSFSTSGGSLAANWVQLGAGTGSGGGGYVYTEVTANTQMVPNAGYIANRVGTICTLTLPAVAAQGSGISILGKSADLWLVAQNAGQSVHINGDSTTTGVVGSISAIDQYNCIELICITANTDWIVRNAMGILTLT